MNAKHAKPEPAVTPGQKQAPVPGRPEAHSSSSHPWTWRSLGAGDKLTAVLGVVGALLAILSLFILHRQTGVMSRQTDIMTEQLRLDQRAWVGPVEVATPDKPTELYGVWLANSGKTPALKVITKVSQQLIPASATFTPAYHPTKEPGSASVLHPGMRIRADSVARLVDFLPQERQQVSRGSHRFYLYGRIEYWDVFERPHWTTFCLYMATDLKSFRVCDRYNDAE